MLSLLLIAFVICLLMMSDVQSVPHASSTVLILGPIVSVYISACMHYAGESCWILEQGEDRLFSMFKHHVTRDASCVLQLCHQQQQSDVPGRCDLADCMHGGMAHGADMDYMDATPATPVVVQ